MKLSATVLLLAAALLSACDDDVRPDEVPVEVRQALLDTFPNSSYIEWDMNGKDYEAEFLETTRQHSALFNATGNLLMHKHAIPEAELPEAIRATIRQNFSGYTLDESERLLKNGDTFYQLEVEAGSKEEQLVLSPDGQLAQLPYWD